MSSLALKILSPLPGKVTRRSVPGAFLAAGELVGGKKGDVVELSLTLSIPSTFPVRKVECREHVQKPTPTGKIVWGSVYKVIFPKGVRLIQATLTATSAGCKPESVEFWLKDPSHKFAPTIEVPEDAHDVSGDDLICLPCLGTHDNTNTVDLVSLSPQNVTTEGVSETDWWWALFFGVPPGAPTVSSITATGPGLSSDPRYVTVWPT